jgi:hypothetical protein
MTKSPPGASDALAARQYTSTLCVRVCVCVLFQHVARAFLFFFWVPMIEVGGRSLMPEQFEDTTPSSLPTRPHRPQTPNDSHSFPPPLHTPQTHPPRSSKLQGRWSSAAGSGTGCVRARPDAALRATVASPCPACFACCCCWGCRSGRAVMSMGGSEESEGAGAPCASKYGGVPAWFGL